MAPVALVMHRHRWRYPHKDMGLHCVCAACHREGQPWYAFIDSGVDLVRGRLPITDLRLVYPLA